MKVLLVTGSYPPMRCGVGDYTARLASALSRDADIKVSVLTSALGAAVTTDPSLEICRAMPTWHKNALRYFSAAMQRIDPDIIHIQFPTQGYDFVNGLTAIAFQARYRYGVPVIVTLHEFLPDSLGRSTYQIYALALLANRIVVVRPEYHARIPWYMKALIGAGKVSFVANASAIPRVTLSEPERDTLKQALGCGSAKLVAFFGFSFPHKGVDLLFRIADPAQHHLLLIGHLSPEDAYHAQLLKTADADPWKGRVTITGFVDPAEAGRLLAASDAAVFPYRVGGGIWNSSAHAAVSQGTFVLITSRERNGYDAEANIYYARPEAVEEMRQALLDYAGVRRFPNAATADPWLEIAGTHKALYVSLLQGKASS